MVKAIWTALALAACVIVVAAAVRVLENALAKRRGEPPA